jgi:hypothetical protein
MLDPNAMCNWQLIGATGSIISKLVATQKASAGCHIKKWANFKYV